LHSAGLYSGWQGRAKALLPFIAINGNLMSRGPVLLIVLLLIIVGAKFFFSSRAHEVPTHTIVTNVSNTAGA
jgi:hypothetical protein